MKPRFAAQLGAKQLVARRGLALEAAEEVLQALRAHVLVGDAPKLADYDGRGPLAAWVRVAAVRAASNVSSQESSFPSRCKSTQESLANMGVAEDQSLRMGKGSPVDCSAYPCTLGVTGLSWAARSRHCRHQAGLDRWCPNNTRRRST